MPLKNDDLASKNGRFFVAIRGTVRTVANIGFVQQKAFIVSDTVENNILFGRPKDQVQFDKVINAAEFATDLVQLPGE